MPRPSSQFRLVLAIIMWLLGAALCLAGLAIAWKGDRSRGSMLMAAGAFIAGFGNYLWTGKLRKKSP